MNGDSGLARLMSRSVDVWRCGDQPVAGSGSSPPPLALLVYLLGPTGAAMGRDVFRFMDGSDPALGPLVVVTDSSLTRPPLLRGPPARYTCRLLQTLPAMVAALAGGGGVDFPIDAHYSSGFGLEKLELLRHLPVDVEAAALLDADSFCLGRCASLLRQALLEAKGAQLVAVARTSSRVNQLQRATRRGAAQLSIPHRSEGVNAGVLVLNASRFRAFERAYCQREPWWRCAMREAPRGGYRGVGGDQAVWNALLAPRRHLWSPLPCGMHSAVDVLRGAALRLARDLRSPLCNRSTGRGVPRWSAADDCTVGVLPSDAAFGPVPRGRAGERPIVAVAHGAARLQALAQLVAALESTRVEGGIPAVRAKFAGALESLPCRCLGHITAEQLGVDTECRPFW